MQVDFFLIYFYNVFQKIDVHFNKYWIYLLTFALKKFKIYIEDIS